MKLPRRRFLHLAAGAAALLPVSRFETAQAQDYPAKPVRIITHSAPGGSLDALLRIVADRLSPKVGTPDFHTQSPRRRRALAQAEAQPGNTVGAENYYQHAEHYFRSMSSA
jgi:hypothetical protein